MLFKTFEEATNWANDKIMNDPEYCKNYSGYVASNICTNDGYCDWGSVSFYQNMNSYVFSGNATF